jgi:MFS family permease
MRNALTSASTLWRNAPLRRLQIAALLSGTSGFGYGTALFVWAFRSGGPSSVGVAGMAVLAPAALLAPFAAVVGDRGRRDRTLAALAGVRAILLLATAVAMASSAPSPVVYAVAALAAVPTRVYYPVQTALLPSLARSDRELAAANALAGAVENVAILAGPGLAGALLAFAAPATVVTLAAVVSALVGLLVRDLGQVAREREEPQHARRDVLAGVATIARNSSLALIVGLFAVETLLFGILTVAVVALAIEDLALGSGGVGLLNASVGSGGVLGGAIALSLAARARHGSNLRLASIGWSLPLALLAILPGLPAALALLVVVGAGNVIVDVASYTLVQHAAADAVRARIFGAFEGVAVTAAATGTLAGGILVADLGARTTLLAVGLALPVLTLVLWRPIGRLDETAPPAARFESQPGLRTCVDA